MPEQEVKPTDTAAKDTGIPTAFNGGIGERVWGKGQKEALGKVPEVKGPTPTGRVAHSQPTPVDAGTKPVDEQK